MYFFKNNSFLQIIFKSPFFYIFLIVLFTFSLYFKSLSNEFVNWDDLETIVNNNILKHISFLKLKYLFIPSLYFPNRPLYSGGNYYPVVMISYFIDFYFFGISSKVFHCTNLIIHLINSILVFVFISLLTRHSENKIQSSRTDDILNTQNIAHRLQIAFIVALLFAIHPLHVESVVWISDRTDLLYALLLLASLIFYIKYIRILSLNKMVSLYYFILSIGFFSISLFSKPMGITFPFILLLIDYYFKRFNFKTLTSDLRPTTSNIKLFINHYSLFIEKIPFLILSVIAGIIIIYGQVEVKEIVSNYNFFDKLTILSYSLSLYVLKAIMPFKLSIVYPYPGKSLGLFHLMSLPCSFYILPLLLIILLIIPYLFFKTIKRISSNFNSKSSIDSSQLMALRSNILFGILFFLISISIVLPFHACRNSFFFEHYSYISYIGLFYIIASCFLFYYYKFRKLKYFFIVIFSAYVLLLSIITYNRIKIWYDSEHLWNDVIIKYPDLSMAYYNRGDAEFHDLQYDEAILDFSKAIHSKKFSALPETYFYRAISFIELNRFNLAMNDLDSAILLNKNYYFAFYNRAKLKNRLKNDTGAVSDFNKAIRYNPVFAEAYFKLANVQLEMNDNKDACYNWKKADSLGYDLAKQMLNNNCK